MPASMNGPARALRGALLAAGALLGLAALAGGPPTARAQEGYPAIEARVTDRADILGSGTEAELEARLARLERDTGAQVVVLTVGSLEGQPIEDYALSVAEVERWGREGVDDGVLLLVARDDRELRIEVGYGLEGAIPDAIANRIIDERIVPAFRAGDFDGGVTAGVAALDELVRGEPLPPPAPRDEPGGFDGGEAFTGLFIAMLWMLIALSRRGVLAWLLYLLMAPLFFFIPYLIVGTPLAWVSFVLWLLLFPPLKWAAGRAGMDGPGGGAWFGGGFGGGSSGGGFGGGGFSGGGGGFGGGGASGSW